MIRVLSKAKMLFGSKKLGIADTAKVIQDKIINITQVVTYVSFRMMSKNLVQSSVLVMVLPEWLVSIKCKQEKWWNLDPEFEVWP